MARTREIEAMSVRHARPYAQTAHRSLAGLLRGLLDGIPWSDRADAEETVRVDAFPGGLFRVQNANGQVQINGEDRADIQVTANKTVRAESMEAAQELLGEIRLAFTRTAEGVALDVAVPRKCKTRGFANLCIRLPREMRVEVVAVNGRVDVEGVRGPVRARSSNGSIKVIDVIGDVEVATSNARVCCVGTCGRLTARSSNGRIEIERHRGALNASTSNGLIRAELQGTEGGGIELATSNGRIVLDLPDAIDADVDIRVDNGTIRNDRPLGHVSRESRERILGRLGNGGAPIKLRTSNGSISLH
jgi:DUF4097 and DUF4098 domain-containing protein YvlB